MTAETSVTCHKSPAGAGRPGNAAFVAVQAVAFASLASLGLFGVRQLRGPSELPPLRDAAIVVRPLYDHPDVVSDEQLQRALRRLRPRLVGTKTLLGDVDHALRCWGPEAEFAGPEFVSGAELRCILTDHRRYAELYGAKQPSLLIDKGVGIAVRTQEGLATTPHTDHTVACLAEIGTPLSFPVFPPEGETTFRAMLEQSLREFSLNQAEYEWTSKLCALFLPPTREWRTERGAADDVRPPGPPDHA